MLEDDALYSEQLIFINQSRLIISDDVKLYFILELCLRIFEMRRDDLLYALRAVYVQC